jgi:class 3 adenylate cyclase
VITVLLNLNYRLIELNNEFGIDSYKFFGLKYSNDAVNIASRMESSGESGKIHISEKTKDYLEGSANLSHRGEIELKNKGKSSTFFLEELK